MQKTYTTLKATVFILFFCVCGLQAQQDPMFTQYMFNSLTFNPAYAGSKNYLSANVLYRTQWAGWNNRGNGLNPELTTGGAPVSQTFTLHSPVGKRVGAGLSIVNDKVGATESTGVNLSYAYRFPFATGKLALALQGGMMNFRGQFNDLIALNPIEDDPAFSETQSSYWKPTFGAGLYYNSEKFYMGVSVPRLIETQLREQIPGENTRVTAQTYQHFYFTLGGAVPVKGNENFVFKPSMLIKSVGLLSELQRRGSSVTTIGAPTQFDLDVSLFIQRTFWIGTSFRSSFDIFISQESSYDSMDAWVALFLKNGLRIGFAYDFSLTPIQDYSVGSFEMSLGYDFSFTEKDKINSPRYF